MTSVSAAFDMAYVLCRGSEEADKRLINRRQLWPKCIHLKLYYNRSDTKVSVLNMVFKKNVKQIYINLNKYKQKVLKSNKSTILTHIIIMSCVPFQRVSLNIVFNSNILTIYQHM